jgi:hypothetical protein
MMNKSAEEYRHPKWIAHYRAITNNQEAIFKTEPQASKRLPDAKKLKA